MINANANKAVNVLVLPTKTELIFYLADAKKEAVVAKKAKTAFAKKLFVLSTYLKYVLKF